MTDLPSFASLAPEKRALLCRIINELLRKSERGLTTAGLRNAIAAAEDKQQRAARYSKVALENTLGTEVPVSMVLDALCGMEQRGAVSRHEGTVQTIWTAIRRPAQSSLTR